MYDVFDVLAPVKATVWKRGTSMSDMHDHGSGSPCPFNDAEMAQFQEADKSAARMVIMLMTGIFLIGLCLYLFVAYSVAT
jgi:hypothetical protein